MIVTKCQSFRSPFSLHFKASLFPFGRLLRCLILDCHVALQRSVCQPSLTSSVLRKSGWRINANTGPIIPIHGCGTSVMMTPSLRRWPPNSGKAISAARVFLLALPRNQLACPRVRPTCASVATTVIPARWPNNWVMSSPAPNARGCSFLGRRSSRTQPSREPSPAGGVTRWLRRRSWRNQG